MISSKWILGFAGERRQQGEGQWYDSFIGGHCVYPEKLDVLIPPCPLCNRRRLLVLQAFAPHNSHSERVIYLFACNSIKCASDEESWFAVRLCKDAHTSSTRNESSRHLDGARDPLDVAGPDSGDVISWDTDSDSDESTPSDIETDLAALSLQVERARDESAKATSNDTKTSGAAGKKEFNKASCLVLNTDGGVPQSQDILCLDSYYVEVAEEPDRSKPIVDDNSVGRLLSKYEKEERSRAASGVSETWVAEPEEPEAASSENYEVFQDRISRAAEQIIRYCFDREPIWPKYPPPRMESKSKCECGSPFVFEVQVLGSCLHYLQPDKSVEPQRNEAGMNFTAVAIYSCQADCTNSEMLANNPSFKMFKQRVVVQQDEW